MKVYIATSFACKADFKKLRLILEANGHEITHDWTVDDVAGREGIDKKMYLAQCAGYCMKGILDADALVLIARPNMAGAFVELGFALGQSIPVIVLDGWKEGNQEPIFYHIPNGHPFQHASDIDRLLYILEDPRHKNPYDAVTKVSGLNGHHLG